MVAIPLHVIILGTGAALPTPERRTSGTAVLYEGETLLFDCGEGTQLQLRKAGLRHGRLSRIFITHMHGSSPDVSSPSSCMAPQRWRIT
jgi:ribonuclease Z